ICVSITVSLGISSFPKNSSDITELLKNADDALYQAKNSGRNCVMVSER
ncbi:MAG: diguanylate cyclase, partial [Clostridiaceae bacterium]|nr:diguanylate cyclase [Clostridiaceae bacterium]